MLIVTIDSGTTNTRVRVWQGSEVIAEASESIGVRDVAKMPDREHNVLAVGIRRLLDKALAHIPAEQPYLIIASGMITSDHGLIHLPHLSAPVNLSQLAEGVVARVIPEISPRPIWFIPGIKNTVDRIQLNNCDEMDVMRGEEVEVFGLLAQHDITGPALVILPGSHSKLIKLDGQQSITACATTIAGELLDVLSQQTLIAQSVEHRFASEIDEEYLFKGADACNQVGLTRAVFSVRILDLFTSATANQRANFLLGAVLCCDLQAAKCCAALQLTANTRIIISGKTLLKEALARLIRRDPFFTGEVLAVDEIPSRPLSGVGAIAVIGELRRLGLLAADAEQTVTHRQ